ncbi:hypothetical protein CEXT_142891 [Caerostris extrusa]|uniref:Secreted protein n=1 Tax=Caerostris extrusa TaxID=172846 RepID=A0AAV4RVJ3_CAEEX|nr:hypothetical protein CEXT_142891 [Caerostris extrusa]
MVGWYDLRSLHLVACSTVAALRSLHSVAYSIVITLMNVCRLVVNDDKSVSHRQLNRMSQYTCRCMAITLENFLKLLTQAWATCREHK